MDDDKLDLEEFQKLLEISKRPKVQQILRNEISKFENKMATKPATKPEKIEVKPISKVVTNRRIRYEQIYSYYFEEDSDNMKIFVTIDKLTNASQAKGFLTFPTKNGFHFKISLNDVNKHFQLKLINLKENINSEKSIFKIRKKKAIIYLKKSDSGHWGDLFKRKDKFADKKKKKDEKDEDPSAGIMNLMKTMYDDGDDNMKRMIKKTWYESRNKSREEMLSDSTKSFPKREKNEDFGSSPDFGSLGDFSPDFLNPEKDEKPEKKKDNLDDLPDLEKKGDLDDLPDLDDIKE